MLFLRRLWLQWSSGYTSIMNPHTFGQKRLAVAMLAPLLVSVAVGQLITPQGNRVEDAVRKDALLMTVAESHDGSSLAPFASSPESRVARDRPSLVLAANPFEPALKTSMGIAASGFTGSHHDPLSDHGEGALLTLSSTAYPALTRGALEKSSGERGSMVNRDPLLIANSSSTLWRPGASVLLTFR